MFAKVKISGVLETVTGLHIGGSSAFSAIGAVDSPVIRDARTNMPMIPGSSCEFPYKSRVMGTSEPLKPLKAPYMARNPVKWGFFRLKGQEIPLKI